MSEKICGIYCIENTINHKKYIGSSLDIYDRWKHHKASLRGNRHHSIHLNNAWNNYGENSFEFYIIEKCKKEKLIEREQHFIDLYKSYDKHYGYNIQPIAGRTHYDGAKIEDLKNGKYKISYKQYLEIDYYLCNTDIPILEVSKIVNISDQILYKIYYGKLYKKIFDNTLFIKRSFVNGENHYNSVIDDGTAKDIIKLLKEGLTNLEISDKLGINNRIVSDIRHHNAWNHLTENIVFPNPKVKQPSRYRKIEQYDLNNNYIKTFNSLTSVMEYLGINGTGNLCSVLNGRRKTAYGYIWKYAS